MEGASWDAIRSRVQNSVTCLLRQMESSEFASFDYVDWWSTRLGAHMKQLAYRTEPLGHLFFSLPLLALEWWLPYLRVPLGIRPITAPIVVAHHGLASLELFRRTGDDKWLNGAIRDARRLLDLRVPDAEELCWGLPFRWSSNMGIMPANQPAATQSGDALDLFEGLWELTGAESYAERVLSIARAMDEEYADIPRGEGLASTYLGRGHGDIVINAITYRIRILTTAMCHGEEKFRSKVIKMTRYVLSQQQPDGGWFYGEGPKDRFIDHYHTCFVLENLCRANQVLALPDITEALERGVGFYWRNLLYANGLPKPFAAEPRFNLVRHESYDCAATLELFTRLGPEFGFTVERLCHVVDWFLKYFWIESRGIRFRIYHIPVYSKYPYYRFGMSAALLAMARILNVPLGS